MSNKIILEKDLHDDNNSNKKKNEWRTIGVRIRNSDLTSLKQTIR